MELYTLQNARYRKAEGVNAVFIDTTVKSGKGAFAPTWDMVLGYKNGTISEEEYTRMYKDRMRSSYYSNNEEWLSLLKSDRIAIGCYCPAGNFCHRLILKDILDKLCILKGIPFVYNGELT